MERSSCVKKYKHLEVPLLQIRDYNFMKGRQREQTEKISGYQSNSTLVREILTL